jgi:hypothetical protein
LLFAIAHGLDNDLIQLVGRVAHGTKYRVNGLGGSACCGRDHPYPLAELTPQEPDRLGDSIVFGREMPAMDFRLYKTLQVIR